MKSIDSQKTVFLIDGSGFLYRAYYGLRPLHTPTGMPVQAVYSFCRMIKKIIDRFDPHSIALVWDSKGATERHVIFPAYKATRQAPPSDLFEQKRIIQEFADAIGLCQVEQQGVEADDLLYSIARAHEKETDVVLITSDKDMAQTLSERITIFDPFKNIFLDRPSFEQSMGFSTEKLPFYYALVGDASDNIPGVPSIGPKGATELVKQFNSLEDLYAHIDTVPKERVRTALITHKGDAFLSELLFKLQYHELGLTREDLRFDKSHWSRARALFESLGFTSLIKEITQTQNASATPTPVTYLSQEKGYEFNTITTQMQLQNVIDEIKKYTIVAIDTEGEGLNPLENKLIGISLATHKGTAYYIPFGHKTEGPQLAQEEVFAALQPVLQDPSIAKVMHHAKFDQLYLLHHNQPIENLTFDTLIAAHLITQDWQRIGLKDLSAYYLQETMLTFAQVVLEKKYKDFSYVPLDIGTEYAAADAHQTLQLLPLLQQELVKQDMQKLYYDIELPLVGVLTRMEKEGVYLDTEVLKELSLQVNADLATLHADIISLIGPEHENINLNSPKQLEQLLFHHLKLPPQKKSGKKTGFSTDVEVLSELAKIHPVPGLIVKYRELFKLKSTYIDALPTYINSKTGKIHTSFSQTSVATGRLASSNPNLQNIPTNSSYSTHIRAAFKPEAGHIFLSADYSQIELRVLAYLSQDKALLHAFEHNVDIHTQTAATLFDVALPAVTHEQRQIGKRINFSILYGLTPYGLSKDLGIPFKDAKLSIEKYFAEYPGVLAWMESVVQKTIALGYVTTLHGRRRYIPGIYEKNRMLYDLARRAAINTVAQGTAAEIMKIGMIKLEEALKKHKLDAKIVLQIHDELLLSVPIEQQEATQKVVHDVLEHVVSWNVPLHVATRFGANWQEVTK